MLKKIIVTLLLAIPLVGVLNQASADAPFPKCYPCEPPPPTRPPA